MTAPLLDGVLVIDKPRGPTSHDVVRRLRRALGVRAIGHAGTLDPMATGVLVVAVGEATKLVPWLTAHDKGYEATVALGIETDTLDAEGAEVRRVAPSVALCEALAARDVETWPALRAALEDERARTLQTPPAYSAIRTGGERAHARARRGERLELAPRPVVVHRLRVVDASAEPPSLQVSLDVGKGYYVRALARDLAGALGTVGHLTALRRTRSGCFTLADAHALDAPAESLRAAIEPLARASRPPALWTRGTVGPCSPRTSRAPCPLSRRAPGSTPAETSSPWASSRTMAAATCYAASARDDYFFLPIASSAAFIRSAAGFARDPLGASWRYLPYSAAASLKRLLIASRPPR
jgi:tRNA pseudouridine55 synthase